MAKCRMLNTKFWDDAYVASLSPNEKLLFLYLLTNPLTTIAGVYEIEVRRMAFDTGIQQKEVTATLAKLQADKKVIYEAPWIAIINWVKHQSLNPKVSKGIVLAIQAAPTAIVEQLELPTRIRLMTADGLQPSSPARARRPGATQISDLLRV